MVDLYQTQEVRTAL